MKIKALAPALAGAALLAGCGGVFQSHERAALVYELRAGAVEPAAVQVAATLVVAPPRVRPGLDTDRIAVTLGDRRLDAYAGARWSAPLGRLVEDLLLEGLRASGGWQAVLPERDAFAGRYLLETEIVEFEADYGAGAVPTVRVSLAGELGLGRERRLIASVAGSAAVPAAADRQREVTAAFESAYRQAAAQLIAATQAAALAAERAGPAAR
jgi:cholesterol transport system auxiliary component